jgi:hypothetical protein
MRYLKRLVWAVLVLTNTSSWAETEGIIANGIGSKAVAEVKYEVRQIGFQTVTGSNLLSEIVHCCPPKTEFETKAEFEERISAQRAKFVNQTSYVWVARQNVQYTYNAEAKTLVIQTTGGGTLFSDQKNPKATVLLDEISEELGTSLGQNAFGVKVDVRKSRGVKYELQVENFLDLPINTKWVEKSPLGSINLGLALPMPPDLAKVVVSNKVLTLLLKIRCVAPENATDKTHHILPKIDLPREHTTRTISVPVEVLGLAVANPTNNVLIAHWSRK